MKNYLIDKKVNDYLAVLNDKEVATSILIEMLSNNKILFNHLEKIFDGGHEAFYNDLGGGGDPFLSLNRYYDVIYQDNLIVALNKDNIDYFVSLLDYIPAKWDISIDLYCDLPKEINEKFGRIYLYIFEENKFNFHLKNIKKVEIINSVESLYEEYLNEYSCNATSTHEVITGILHRMINYDIK